MQPDRFIIEDDVATSSARPVEWYFHSDQPIARENAGFVLGGPPGLRLTYEGATVDASVEPTFLVAPGQPGSITSGAQERRGFHVKLQSEAVTLIHLRTVLELQAPGSRQP